MDLERRREGEALPRAAGEQQRGEPYGSVACLWGCPQSTGSVDSDAPRECGAVRMPDTSYIDA